MRNDRPEVTTVIERHQSVFGQGAVTHFSGFPTSEVDREFGNSFLRRPTVPKCRIAHAIWSSCELFTALLRLSQNLPNMQQPSRAKGPRFVIMIRSPSLFFGLLIGAMWMGQVLFGNLGDTPVLGNVRTLHFYEYSVVGWSFIYGALAFTTLSGFYSAYLTGKMVVALRVAVWSGLISGAITLATGMGMTILFLDAFRQSPSDLAEFARSGDQSFSHLLITDALGSGLNHLWIGVGLGLILGSLGAIAGKPFYRPPLPR
jgi:hypothetical protein